MIDPHFASHREAALGLLTDGKHLTRKAAQFLGQICVDRTPLSEKQRGWLATLLNAEGMPPLVN